LPANTACKNPLDNRFSKCSVRSPRAPQEKPQDSASYFAIYSGTSIGK